MVRRVLVVCTANVCRSPVAERLLTRRLADRVDADGEPWVVTSAGTADVVAPLDPNTVSVAAAAAAYPPGGPTLTLSATTVAPGGTFAVTFNGCSDGELVSVSIAGGDSGSATCSGAEATVTLTAPTAPGTYTVTGTTSESGLTATATLTVAAAAPAPAAPGQLPTTGSGSSVPIAQIAAGVLIAGAGWAGVAMTRRRPAARI